MDFKKLFNILAHLMDIDGRVINGDVDCTSDGELRFSFNHQLERSQHNFLIKQRFIYNDFDKSYTYRP